MFDDDILDDAGKRPKTPIVQDHVIHFELVHDHIIRFGNKVKTLSEDWHKSAMTEMDGITATSYKDGFRMLSVGSNNSVDFTIVAVREPDGKVRPGSTVDYDFMAETLLEATYKYVPQIDADQAFIAKLDI